MTKNPYRLLGTIFASIAAVEAVVVLVLLVVKPQEVAMIAAPFAIQCPIFGGIGVGFLIYVHKKQQLRERLLANGYYETATVAAVEQNGYVRVNHRSPYYVVCRVERNGVLHEYRSESFFHHPGLRQGDQVKVYLDRQNEKNYYVDVENAMPRIVRH